MKCKDCKWWRPLGDSYSEPSGQCRRYSPKRFMYKDEDLSIEENISASEDGVWPWTKEEDWCGEFKPKEPEILQQPIIMMCLSARTRNCLETKHINTIGDLVKLTPTNLLGIKGFGMTSLREVRRKLSNIGLWFGGKKESTEEEKEDEAKAEAAVKEALGIEDAGR